MENVKEMQANIRRLEKAFPSFCAREFDDDNRLTFDEIFERARKTRKEEEEKKKEDFELARAKCPRLYVDPKLFAVERAVLARNLMINNISKRSIIGLIESLRTRDFYKAVDAIFNLFSLSNLSNFEKKELISSTKGTRKNDTAANLWLISHFQKILEKIKSEQIELDEALQKRTHFWLLGLEKSKEKTKSEQRWFDETPIRIAWSGEMAAAAKHRLKLLRKIESLLSKMKPTELSIKKYIKTLFLEIFPPVKFPSIEFSPTFVVKYNVLRHPKDENLRCIQYFFYWPIQVFPKHFFDYEPVYVYVYKLEHGIYAGKYVTFLVLFNGAPNLLTTLKTLFLSLFRKRPGHLIRMFFNDTLQIEGKKSIEYLDREIPFWERDSSGEILDLGARLWAETYRSMGALATQLERNQVRVHFDFSEYYKLGNFMTKAYSGQYVYEKKPPDFDRCMIRRLLDEDNYVSLCIPKSLGFPLMWHAFDQCTPDILQKKDWIVNLKLLPLDHRDMLHIEWNVNQPFQAPFLYPLVGGKNPLMHYPLDALDLVKPFFQTPTNWRRFCDNEWGYSPRLFHPGWINLYRVGKLIEFLCVQQGKDQEIVKDLWKKIEDYYNKQIY